MIRHLSKKVDEGQSTNGWVDSDEFPTVYFAASWVCHYVGPPCPAFISCSPHCSFPWHALFLVLPCFGMTNFLSGHPWWAFLAHPLRMQCFFHFTSMMSHWLLFALMASRPVVFPTYFVICFVICWPVGLDDDWPVDL